jgi:putative membrane protein
MAQADREHLAQDRTDLAEDRTVLAQERSFASWLRTGLGSVGVGLGFGALFRMLEPDWVAKAIASVFLLTAVFIFVSAARRARQRLEEIDHHEMVTRGEVPFRFVAWTLAAGTSALCGAIWLLG